MSARRPRFPPLLDRDPRITRDDGCPGSMPPENRHRPVLRRPHLPGRLRHPPVRWSPRAPRARLPLDAVDVVAIRTRPVVLVRPPAWLGRFSNSTGTGSSPRSLAIFFLRRSRRSRSRHGEPSIACFLRPSAGNSPCFLHEDFGRSGPEGNWIEAIRRYLI
jgi:hypothetical protein